MRGGLRVKGYRELLRACDRAGKDTKRFFRAALRTVGEAVRQTAAEEFQDIDPRSAAGYRVVVRQRGVAVEQSLRRTTGLHPEFGVLQMREALLPALDENEHVTAREMDRALGTVEDRFALN